MAARGNRVQNEGYDTKGFVAYGKKQLFWDREKGLKFKTPSGKIEFKSSLSREPALNLPSMNPYPNHRKMFPAGGGPDRPTHPVSTQNNPYLNELCGENVLWINKERAAELGIGNGDSVEVGSSVGKGQIPVKATDLIHPEIVFMLHGFGHEAESASGGSKRRQRRPAPGKPDRQNWRQPGIDDTFVKVTPV